MAEQVRVQIVGDAKDLARATDEATGSLGGLKRNVGGLSLPLLGVAGLAAGAAVAIGKMTMAAAEDRDEQAKLRSAVIASGAATNAWEKQMNDAIAAGQALAFSDSEVRAGLLPLVQSTGDMEEATKLLATAQDVARLSGVDLETASKAVAKAHEGSEGALKRLVPALAGAAEGTDVIAEAQRLAAGQADTFAQSTEGQLLASQQGFDELQETIGSAFLPVLDKIVPLLIPIITKLGELIADILPPLIDALTPVVEALGIFLDVAGDILRKVLPALLPMLRTLGDVMKATGEFIGDAVGFIEDLINGLRDLLKPLQDALGGLQGLLDFKMPSFDFPDLNPFSAPAPAPGRGLRPGVVINTGADPQAVVRIARAHLSANGAW